MPFSFFNKNDYHLLARLHGSEGPINCLAFTKDGNFLASGGDDEIVRIWDVNGRRVHQELRDREDRWGQVTCFNWLLEGIADRSNGHIAAFGTGRGIVLVYQKAKDRSVFKEVSHTRVFAFNEPVEAMDHDRYKFRLVVSSHFGKIKMFSIERNGALLLIWERDMSHLQCDSRVILRAVKFVERGERIIGFTLESGTMISRLSTTGAENWSKTLMSSIGNVSISPNEDWVLVDNLASGFDLYEYSQTSPSDRFTIPRNTACVHAVKFLEGGRLIACGSDHGTIYLFGLGTSKRVQKLKHGSKKSLIQAIDDCVVSRRYLIASGSSDGQPMICIWEKTNRKGQSNSGIFATVILLVAFVLASGTFVYQMLPGRLTHT